MMVLLIAALILAGWSWLDDNPGHNPFEPLDLSQEPGWATKRKLTALRDEPDECYAVLNRSGVAFAALDPVGEGACRREDRVRLTEVPLSPDQPEKSCALGAAIEYWVRHGLQPAAEEILGSPLVRIEHMGTFSCRRLYGRSEGTWSQHATSNAIDIAGFTLEDGRHISILRDWGRDTPEGEFLESAKTAACDSFATVLTPEYNEAHADHFHLDQQSRAWGVCR